MAVRERVRMCVMALVITEVHTHALMPLLSMNLCGFFFPPLCKLPDLVFEAENNLDLI